MNVFFDVDGTLHDGDMFESYVRFIAQRSQVRRAALLPILLLGLLAHRLCPDSRWSLNALLWPLTVGRSDAEMARLDAEFILHFNGQRRPFSAPLVALQEHLQDGRRVFLVSGTPEHLIRAAYPDLSGNEQVTIVGSTMRSFLGSRILAERCVCSHKPRLVKQKVGEAIKFEAGYSDSIKDIPMLRLCATAFRVTTCGSIEPWGPLR